ncbi:MAG: surface lipoprotein assembly modifier [Chromatocurvus sp.]
MHSVNPRPLLLAVTLLCGQAAVAAASDQSTDFKRTWSATVGAGREYDSNVSVSEVDASSGESDYAWTLDLGVGVNQSLGQKTDLALNYDFSQSQYDEFPFVDRQTHIVGANLSTDLTSTKAGLSAYYINSRLDGDPFLEYLRLSPSLSGFLSKRWFARGAYVYAERTISDRNDRDADTHSLEGDLYYFHRGLRSYFNIGYRYRDENTVLDALDFTSHGIKLRYIRRFNVLGTQAKGEISWRYEERRYLSPDPVIEAKRSDDRGRFKLDLEVPLGERATLQWYYSYGDFASNLPRADFTQTIVGTRVEFKW